MPFDKKFYDKRADLELAQHYYGDFAEFSEYKDGYYDIENPIVLHWLNRGSNFINMAISADVSKSYMSCRPFFDNKVIEFIASLPNEYLQGYKLYTHLALKHYPKFFKNIGRNSLKPLYYKKDLCYLINKVKFKINKKLQKKGIIPKVVESYTDYEKWIEQEPTKSEIAKYLSSKDAFYKNYTDDFLHLYLSKNQQDSYADKILKLCSAEIYFEKISRFM